MPTPSTFWSHLTSHTPTAQLRTYQNARRAVRLREEKGIQTGKSKNKPASGRGEQPRR
jgi:hypothetical protein